MFVGRFEHTLDDKGRVVLPAAFREQLAAGCYVAKGPDRCLRVYRTEEFEREAAEMVDRMKRQDMSLNAMRTFFSGAAPLKPDAQGRLSIPNHLREYARLSKDVVVIGVFTSIELWDAPTYAPVEAEGEASLVTTVL